MENQVQADRRIVVKNMLLELDKDEQIQRGRELDDVLGQIESVKEQAKADAQRHNGRVAELQSRVHALRSAISSGKEWKDVQCYERADERRATVDFVRCSDDHVVGNRAMTRDELQPSLPNVEEAPKKRNGRKKKGGEAWAKTAIEAANEAPPDDGDDIDPEEAEPSGFGDA